MILLFGANGQLGQEMVRASAARKMPLVALARAAHEFLPELALSEDEDHATTPSRSPR